MSFRAERIEQKRERIPAALVLALWFMCGIEWELELAGCAYIVAEERRGEERREGYGNRAFFCTASDGFLAPALTLAQMIRGAFRDHISRGKTVETDSWQR